METRMNNTTKAQREEWISLASRLINLDASGQCTNEEVLAILSQDAIPGVTPFVTDGVTNEQVCLCVEGRLNGREYGGAVAVMREINIVTFAAVALWMKAKSWIEEHKYDS